MTVTARSNAACEPGVRASSAARSRSISSRSRARSIAAEVVAMPAAYDRGRRRGGRLSRRRASASAAGHGRQDHERVGAADGRLETVEDANVLVVEVDVDVPVEAAVV